MRLTLALALLISVWWAKVLNDDLSERISQRDSWIEELTDKNQTLKTQLEAEKVKTLEMSIHCVPKIIEKECENVIVSDSCEPCFCD